METIDYSKLFTSAQMSYVIKLWCEAKTSPNKAILAYINSEPSILKACKTHEVFPPCLAYLLEYQLSCKQLPVDRGPLEGTSN